MKTTVDLPDGLFRAARRLAVKEGATFRALVEEGLRAVLESRQGRHGFTLRDASFGGDGTSDDVRLDDWEAIRDLSYTGRGA